MLVTIARPDWVLVLSHTPTMVVILRLHTGKISVHMFETAAKGECLPGGRLERYICSKFPISNPKFILT